MDHSRGVIHMVMQEGSWLCTSTGRRGHGSQSWSYTHEITVRAVVRDHFTAINNQTEDQVQSCKQGLGTILNLGLGLGLGVALGSCMHVSVKMSPPRQHQG